jgi:uncharacterized protein (DUF1499 family)
VKKRMIYLVLLGILLAPVIVLAVFSALAKKPDNLGVTDGKLAPCPNNPNCVSTQAADDPHRIAPLTFDCAPDEAMKRLKAVIAALPRLHIITETEEYLYVEATSLIFRFVDDVEFLVDRKENLIHFRSASRVGRSDLGVNRARMEQVRKLFIGCS